MTDGGFGWEELGLRKVDWGKVGGLKKEGKQVFYLPPTADRVVQDSYARDAALQDAIAQGQPLQQQILPTGLPAEWDYQAANETRGPGPWGQPLPQGSIQWNPRGEPDWGPGVGGWSKKWLNRFGELWHGEGAYSFRGGTTALEETVSRIPEEYVGYKPPDTTGMNKWDAWWSRRKYDLGMTIQGIKYAWTRLEEREKNPLVLRMGAHMVGAFVDGVGSAFQQGEILVKRIITPMAIVGDEWWKQQAIENDEQLNAANTMYKLINQYIPVAREGLKVVMGIPAMFDPEYQARAEEYHQEQIWRMGYTAMYDATAREEYMRRARAGEDVRMLAMELENPTAELLAGLVLDPINLWDAKIGPALKTRKELRVARGTYGTVVPGLEGLGDDLAKIASSASDDLAATASLAAAKRIQGAVSNVKNNIVELGGRRGPLTLSQGGKHFVYNRRVGSHLAAALSSPQILNRADRALEYVEGLVKIASDDVAEIAEGAHLLGRVGYPVSLTFSEAGLQTAAFLRDMLLDPKTGRLADLSDFTKGLKASGWDVAKATDEILGKLNKSLEKFAPDLQKQIKQADEYASIVKKYGADSPQAIRYLRKAPQADRAINATWRLIAKADAKARPIYRIAGRVQSTLYMGLSPAYYVRNKISNMVHVFVDQGFKSGIGAVFTPGRAEAELLAALGFIPSPAKLGFGPMASLTGTPPGGVLNFFSRKSAQTEAGASLHVYNVSVRNTMGKALVPGRAIPQASELLPSLPKETQDLIMDLAKKHNGMPEDVIEALLNAQTKGGYDTARNLLFLSRKQVDDLKSIGLYDDIVRRTLEANTVDDAIASIDDAVRDWRKSGRAAGIESPEIATDLMDETQLAEFSGAAHMEDAVSGVAGREAADLIKRQYVANSHARSQRLADVESLKVRATAEINTRFVTEGVETGLYKTVEEAQAASVKLVEDVTSPIHNTITDMSANARMRHNDILDGTRSISKASLAGEGLEELWQRGVDLGVVKGKMPAGISDGAFRDILWPGYRDARATIWYDYHDSYLGLIEGEARSLAAAAWPDDAAVEFGRAFRNSDAAVHNAELFKKATMSRGGAHVYYPHTMSGVQDLIEDSVFGNTKLRVVETHEGLIDGRVISLRVEKAEDGAVTIATSASDGRVLVDVSDEILNLTPAEFHNALRQEISRGLGTALPPQYVDELGRLFPLEDVGEAAPGLKRVYQGRPSGFDPAGGYSTSWSEDPTMARDWAGDAGEIVWKDVPEEDWLRAVERATTEGVAQGTGTRAAEAGLLEGRFDPDFAAETRALGVLEESPFADNFSQFLYQREVKGLDLADAGADFTEAQSRFFQRIIDDPANKAFVEMLRDIQRVEASRGMLRLPLMHPHMDGMPSPARFAHETGGEVARMAGEVKAGVQENWGRLQDVTMVPQQMKELHGYLDEMGTRVAEARQISMGIAEQARDFALHAYPKRTGLDLAFSYIFPYHFWHSRTYMRWMERLKYSPAVLSSYFKYRRYLEHIHPGLPDWWKYQLNSNELLGMDSEHPLYFNLESTLNPLQGVTGVDFEDPKRRADWWGSTMEDLNKFGPTVWTPYQLILALKYHMEGKEDAAARWAGRTFTGTRFFRDATALMGFGEGKGIEVDPLINFFSGGIDAHERARIGRQLGSMQQEGVHSPASIIDASATQEGPIWDEAWTRAVNERALGNTAAFFLGTGFKPRSQNDIQIDRMYSERNALYLQKDFLSPEEYRRGWDDLKAKYPFMDAVVLAKKGGLERDETLAWNVLSRIPPGATAQIAERVGINREDLDAFYDSKGNLKDMPEAKRLRFMAAVMDIGALLDMPEWASRVEWNGARDIYRAMRTEGEALFGEFIWDKVDIFYASEDKETFMRNHPDVQLAMDWQQQTIISAPLLAAYYTSAERIEKYYKGLMYAEAERMFGEELWDHFEVYYQLKEVSPSAARRYWREHPQLKKYGAFKDKRLPEIEEKVAEVGALIREGAPPAFREGMEPVDEPTRETDRDAWVQAQVMSYLAGAGDVSLPSPAAVPDWMEFILSQPGGNELYNLIMDAIRTGEPLPDVALRRLQELGIPPEQLFQ